MDLGTWSRPLAEYRAPTFEIQIPDAGALHIACVHQHSGAPELCRRLIEGAHRRLTVRSSVDDRTAEPTGRWSIIISASERRRLSDHCHMSLPTSGLQQD
jgi:hypothetical protein